MTVNEWNKLSADCVHSSSINMAILFNHVKSTRVNMPFFLVLRDEHTVIVRHGSFMQYLVSVKKKIVVVL